MVNHPNIKPNWFSDIVVSCLNLYSIALPQSFTLRIINLIPIICIIMNISFTFVHKYQSVFPPSLGILLMLRILMKRLVNHHTPTSPSTSKFQWDQVLQPFLFSFSLNNHLHPHSSKKPSIISKTKNLKCIPSLFFFFNASDYVQFPFLAPKIFFLSWRLTLTTCSDVYIQIITRMKKWELYLHYCCARIAP